MNQNSFKDYLIILGEISQLIGVDISKLQQCEIRKYHDDGKIPELLIIDKFGNDFDPELDISEIEYFYEETEKFQNRIVELRLKLGKKLESARVNADLSIEDVSNQTRFSKGYIHDVESGYEGIDEEGVYLLCDVYNAEFGDIIASKAF